MQEQGAFKKLKRLLTTAPVLAVPDNNCKFWMKVDASGYVVGGVLSQQQSDDSWQPVVYISQVLNKTERNCKIYDWELLAIMTGLKQWWHYLADSKRRVPYKRLKGSWAPGGEGTDYGTLSNGKSSHLRNRRTEAKSSKGHLIYVGTSTTATPTHLGSP